MRIKNHERSPVCKSWILFSLLQSCMGIISLCNHGRYVIHILQSWTLSYVAPPPLRISTNTHDTVKWTGHVSQGYWASLISSFYVEAFSVPFSSLLYRIDQRSQSILFSVVFTPSPPQPPRQCLPWVLPVISLLITNTVSPAPNHMMGRFRGTQKKTIVGILAFNHRLNMELNPKFIWAPVYSCTH